MNKEYYTYNEFSSTPVAIPVIQRDYVQGANANSKKRNGFFESLLDALLGEESFEMDFIYGSTDEKSDKSYFQPIDGQQRLTTLALLAWVLNNRLKGKYNAQLPGITYLTRPSSEQFTKHLFGYCIPGSYTSISEYIKTNPGWFSRRWLDDPTINAILEGLDYMDSLLNHEKYKDRIEEIANRFFNNSPLCFECLDMQALNLGDDLYIKMNARGKMLTSFENWKAGFEGILGRLFKDKPYVYGQIPGMEDTPSVTDYFIYAIEHDWCDMLWPNAYKRWSALSDKEKKKVSYPRIDEEFMNILNFISRVLFFSSDDISDFKRSTFEDSLEANREKLFSSIDNVNILMRILDTLVRMNKLPGGSKAFFESIFTNKFDGDGVRINIYTSDNEGVDLLQACLDDKIEIVYEIILWAVLKYLLAHPGALEHPDRNFRDYLLIVVGWVRGRRQRLIKGLRVAPNLRLDDYPEAVKIINDLSDNDDVFAALNETTTASLAEELRKGLYVNQGKYDIIRVLSGCEELYFDFGLLYDSIDASTDNDAYIEKFMEFINMRDEDRIRTLLRYGYNGIQPMNNYYFYGLNGHWDYIFTLGQKEESYEECSGAFTGYFGNAGMVTYNKDSFSYYLLKYTGFLNAYYAKNDYYYPMHYFMRDNGSTYNALALKTMSTMPRHGFNVDPFGDTVVDMFKPSEESDYYLTDYSNYSDPGYLYIKKGDSDVMFARCYDLGWELSVPDGRFSCIKRFF